MLKPGLGKGLGDLMNGDRVAGRAAPSRPAAEMGRGLTTLVADKQPEEEEKPKVLLPAWFFFSADLLLLAYSVAICFDAPKPLELGPMLFCAASITTGAILAIAGVLRAS